MNRKRAGTFLCLMLSWCMSGASAGQRTTSNAPPFSDAEQQVMKVEDAWAAAEHNRDAAALRRILSDKFIGTFGTGKPVGKEASIQKIANTAFDPTDSQTLTERNVIIDGDTAISTGTDTQHGTRNGAAYTAVARYTATYIRQWKLVGACRTYGQRAATKVVWIST